ncbi:TIGR01777 family protein [Aeromicrobium sp. A1-2]|uniref:TIGR01777 family oxidoreductase n=1 Tax=Aeromicrobium sp. A1-2 TaxID=2107713 RepID=UPI000E4D6EFB|nr:TIGR01777 family oxidoreductase [Aeromicrobium sp. A1-2]AXT84679.1 TIGR01777 family protein [Aeromicrobium sp. A1-2]
MQIVIGGASGFLGTALTAHLRARGHQVTRLVRSGQPADDSSTWDPSTGRIDQIVIDRADVVVNLSGSSVSKWPRTRARAQEIVTSRTTTTGTLAKAIAASPTPPAMISASGMSYYGTDRGDELLTESSSAGEGFLPDVVRQWEAAASPAIEAGARVCFVRTSLVLDGNEGILGLMVPVWKLGGGARLGSGRQYMSFISVHDWVRGVEMLIESPDLSGPFNFAAPTAVTNAEFTDALGAAVHRPTFLAAPAFALKLALGGISADLLGSLRIAPRALTDAGFTFSEPDIGSTLEAALR